jgi:hypothetical protein
MQLSEAEKIAGKRADFRITYKRNNKTYFDDMWAPNAAAAEAKFNIFARELGWKDVIVSRIEAIR